MTMPIESSSTWRCALAYASRRWRKSTCRAPGHAKNHEDAMERGAGPNTDDWTGLPFNESGRAKALSYSQSIISMPERICWFYTQWHIAAGPFGLKIWNEYDQLTGKTVAWVIGAWEDRARHDHLDGRPPASLEKRPARSKPASPPAPGTATC